MKKQSSGNGSRAPEPAAPQQRGRVIAKLAEYVGSFAVESTELQQKAHLVQEQLQALKDCPRRRPVVLKFCLQGLKMYSVEGEALLMAHALRRILFSTWRPTACQFAFVARNPRSPPSRLFCHLFVGSQPSEAQALHLLLCRSFQLCYLLMHPEEQDWPPSGSAQRESGRLPGASPESRLVWESLSPEEVSQNVNALVSFRRLPCPADFGPSFSVRERLDLEERSSLSNPRPGNPYCSPILVRKKAIRSKILRSGAYRGCTFEGQLLQGARDLFHTSCDSKGSRGSLAYLSENDGSLMENVWSFAGIDRDAAMGLLRKDVLGAFLLWAEPSAASQWCLTVRTRCGVIPYQIYRSQLGKFSVEPADQTPSLLRCCWWPPSSFFPYECLQSNFIERNLSNMYVSMHISTYT
ncbi:SH2 domain-containing protein 5 isoform X2 [Hemicordylus capensis]|uniref:SH2 domain-containing protein 5 isoform X2 n=1 Tax=Hemicordylus capensis TaxID=884348 RepID=UPI002302FA43|nr:SH2 domain-containing protein 5 isoform X2 [Hemicordylus capensis]